MNSYWFLAASAGATLLLAIAAFLSIRQTRKLQERERKDRLLNEIIEWAITVMHANFGGELLVTPGLSEKLQRRRDSVNRLLQCQVLEVQGKEIVEPIALSISQELSYAVRQVVNSIKVVNDILRNGVPYIESNEAVEALKANDTVLENNLRELVNKTAKYKITS